MIAFIPSAADFSVRGDQYAFGGGAAKVNAQKEIAAGLREVNRGNAGLGVAIKKGFALVFAVKKRFRAVTLVNKIDGFASDGFDQIFKCPKMRLGLRTLGRIFQRGAVRYGVLCVGK